MIRLVLAVVIILTTCAQPAPEILTFVQSLPKLPLTRGDVWIQPPSPGWEIGMISTLSADEHGAIYLLQRGPKADPIVVVNRQGQVLRSWGAGRFEIPHAIRIASDGNVWTTDSSSSVVRKFSPQGAEILQISVGGQPPGKSGRPAGTTDIAFAPNGRLFISDGYGNARILEYKAGGNRTTEWGSPGTEPGQFHLPHAIVADDQNNIYVADRENGRIQRFDLSGKYLGEWDYLGKPMSLSLGLQNTIWVGTNRTSGALTGGWVLQLDRRTGKVLGYLEAGDTDIHAMTTTRDGDVLIAGKGKIAWFHAAS
jgi:hypothetical protein